ncbi:ATP-binding protein [Halpernia frigidisoli]|uniref:histidine kinase n=1 Tax=Halpernia frigidisoli TaxID=1125876 RepID=A0A1I3IZ68_9FLAO|nr:ATP-binding protein [Halpernia frigidisoli]SFI53279.1 Bacteriophytochrome (light-regulated signal transduction histidine kinase) [Halpernia frigidisoli]
MDFVACHEEQIHIPGYIQSFGYLIGLDSTSKKIKFFSENLPEIFPVKTSFFGKNLEDFDGVFSAVTSSDNYRHLSKNSLNEAEISFNTVLISNIDYHFTGFRSGEFIFLQFEKNIEEDKKKIFLSCKYDNINKSKSEEAIWNNLLSAFTDTVGYDRMMVYQFLEDGSGKVIAEKKNDNIESYLHLHYPESDIPKQARELYLKNKKRILSDADCDQVAILSETDEKINLTHSDLRAMSPIHNQYLKNGGAVSSFSTSIIIDEKLWGLVTCQNITQKHINLINRIQAEVLTIIAANTYTAVIAKQSLEVSLELDKKNALLMQKFLNFENLDIALYENIEEICKYPDADGVAIIIADKIETFGSTPSEEDILKVRDWVRDDLTENFFFSNEFKNSYFPDIKNAAGMATAYIDNTKKELILWFRKELDEDILWAGNPEKTFESVTEGGVEKMMISPRKSFAIYRESIKGKSEPWKLKDEIAMRKVVEIVLKASHSQFVKVKELVAELKEVNEELDSFSYTVSHDLGTPLTVMKINAQMLLMKNKEDENLQKRVGGIISEIDGMADMMRNVLQLSKSKSQEIVLKEESTKVLIEKISSDSKLSYGKSETEIIVKDCPAVLADKTMLYQIFLNVITNAVKYSAQQENPLVEINGEIVDNEVVYKISDNGIGIQKEEENKMFKVFSRMDNARSYKGNGIGLSIVNRIMNRIGGEISYESFSGKGTTFILKFQKP